MPTTFDPVKLGPCAITFGSLDIALTKGGVVLRVEALMKEITIDQYGSSAVDDRIVGWSVKAIVPLAQTDYATLKQAAIFLQEQGSGALVDRKLGASMRNIAQPLTLHPVENDVADKSEDAYLYLAAPTTAMEMKYGFEDERIYNVEFKAYPKAGSDPSEPGNFFVIGDPAAIATLETVTFTVSTALAAPIPGAVVSVVGIGSALTNALGQAIFHLVAGDYVYAVEREGYNTAYNAFTVAAAPLAVPVTLTV